MSAPSEEAVREVSILNEALDNATAEVERARAEAKALREAVRGFLNGAPLNEHGRFKDARLEALYRAAGGRE
jgi:hypothetical protein